MFYCDVLNSQIRRDLFDSVGKCCPRIGLVNNENKFIYYLFNSSGSIFLKR